MFIPLIDTRPKATRDAADIASVIRAFFSLLVEILISNSLLSLRLQKPRDYRISMADKDLHLQSVPALDVLQ